MEKIEINGLYRIQKEDLCRCAEVAARAFLNDESSKFILASKLTYETLCDYYLLVYKAAYNKMHMFSESKDINGFIIVSTIKNSELSLFDCVKTGGIKTALSLGLGVILRSLAYEKNCIKIRNNFVSNDTWHIFQFGVSSSKQGQGLGSKIMKTFLNWLDSNNSKCYLETQNEKNVGMYSHFGFSLKSTDTMPKTTSPQFAMLR